MTRTGPAAGPSRELRASLAYAAGALRLGWRQWRGLPPEQVYEELAVLKARRSLRRAA